MSEKLYSITPEDLQTEPVEFFSDDTRYDLQQIVKNQQRKFSRRNFLHAAGSTGLLATLGMASWDATAELLRDHNKVNIDTLKDDEAARQFPHTTTLYLPGLKNTWHESAENLKALQPALRNFGQMASVGYSNRGFSEDEIFYETLNYLTANNIHTVNLYGGSMGGLLAVALAPRLINAGYTIPAIFCDSSPSGPESVRSQLDFKCMVWGYELGLTLPECLRFTGEYVERREHMNERTPQQIWDQSWEQLGPTACSSYLVQTEAYYIDKFKLADYDGKLGTTKIAYLGAQNDVVVNHDIAVAQWRKELPHNFMYTPYSTGNVYHASPKYGKDQYVTQVTYAAHDLRLIPKTKSTVKYD